MAERSERSLGLEAPGEISAPEADRLLEAGRKARKRREREQVRSEARKIARNAVRYHEMVDHDDVTGGHHG